MEKMLTAMSQPVLRSHHHHHHHPHAGFFPPSSRTHSMNHPPSPTLVYNLDVVQQPVQARAMGWGSKADSRRPVDPPPVINLSIHNDRGDCVTAQVTNSFILHASLIEVDSNDSSPNIQNRLTGTTMYSLTHLRSPSPGKFFFLLHDLSIRQEGKYKLLFDVYEVQSLTGIIKHRAQTTSGVITVYTPKTFPGLESSSDLVKEIASQGCKVRVRKESATKKKRNSRSRLSNASNDALPVLPDYYAQQQQHHQQQQQLLTQHQQQIMAAQQQVAAPPHTQPAMILTSDPAGGQFALNYGGGYFDYKTTPMLKSSSGSSSSVDSATSTGSYYRGYESLLMAAAVTDNSQHEYTHSMPPTPSTAYDRERLLRRSSNMNPAMPPPSPAQSPPVMAIKPEVDAYGMYLQRGHSDIASSPTLPPPHQLIYDNSYQQPHDTSIYK
ncbi:hypothetical protein TRICI_003450 [Trichomonascus ciferrii]|uniref:Velvet domain-containing protein n=1 Tax=Trichomonascus ciferrii TaxID=44093 RepID=A0A642VA43_9ASCO|nr:hypothetical protein TRICI_003450 [Trichomonascus ciferrii]